MSIDLIIRGAICVSHRGYEKADIAVRDGIIVAIGQFNDIKADHVIDAHGLHILPGVIDTDFNFTDHVETDESGSKTAVMGGVTSVISKDRNIKQIWCDHGYFVSASKLNISQLDFLEKQEGCAGVYVDMSDHDIADDKTLLKVMENGSRRIMVHAEDRQRLDQRKKYIKQGNAATHPLWHDRQNLLNATRRILAIARAAGRQIHISHVATEDEMAMIAANKDIATLSVTPAHLSLRSEDCYEHYGNYVLLDPPIFNEKNRTGLWKAISGGIVDMLGSQHNAQSIASKKIRYPECPPGFPAVHTMLPLMLDQVKCGVLSLQTLMDLTSAGPARAFNIACKGRMAVGYDADFTLVDLKKEWIFEDDAVMSGCGWDLSAGQKFTGYVQGTIIRGNMIMWDGDIIGDAKGQTLRYSDTFKAYAKE